MSKRIELSPRVVIEIQHHLPLDGVIQHLSLLPEPSRPQQTLTSSIFLNYAQAVYPKTFADNSMKLLCLSERISADTVTVPLLVSESNCM